MLLQLTEKNLFWSGDGFILCFVRRAYFFSGAKVGGRLNRQERKKRGTQGVIAGYTEITAWKKL